MLHNPGVTEVLAKFVVGTRWDDLPPQVTHQAKRSLMNFFAVALTGCRDQTFETALQTLAAFSGGRQATLIGRRERIDALSAAFLNAAGANVLDFCDTHVPTAIHPTAPLAPALLALGELKPVSGRDLIRRVRARPGSRMPHRACDVAEPLQQRLAHHRDLRRVRRRCRQRQAVGAESAQMVWALGTAATQAAGLCECLGTPAKSVGVGNAARNGLWAALLAEKNFAGPAEPLNGMQGYYNALNETPKLSALTDRLGESWEIMADVVQALSMRLRVHPVIDCVLGWRRDNPVFVDKVMVTGNPLMAARADRPNISTGRESQVSVQHAVAAALVTGKAGLAQFTDACVNDPAVRALRGKVEVLAR